MPTQKPRVNVTLEKSIFEALAQKAGGTQRISDYVRKLIEADLGIKSEIKHGGNRHQEK